MPLELRPCTPADFPRIVQVEHDAYADDQFTPILFPGSNPDMEIRIQDIAKQNEEDPTTRWMKIVDTDLDSKQGIAFAKWNMYHDQAPPLKPLPNFGPDANIEACTKVFGGLIEQRKRVLGDRRCVYLHMLSTDPNHTRRGAGSMLMRWGIEQAEKYGVPTYMEASPQGRGLYAKHGFKVIEEQTTDLSQWGAKEPHRCWAMIRETE